MARINSRLACGGRKKANLGLAIASTGMNMLGNIVGGILNGNAQRKAIKEYNDTQRALGQIQSANNAANIVNQNLASNQALNRNYDFDDNIIYRCGGRKKAVFGWTNLLGTVNNLLGTVGMVSQLGNTTSPKSIGTALQQGFINDATDANILRQAATQTFKCGGRKKARSGIARKLESPYITDGGVAIPIGRGLSLLRGATHEDINETGQTGIGIQVGRNQIEAQDGEVAQKKGRELRIFSDEPLLYGISPADAVEAGYNPDVVFAAQEAYKDANNISDDGSLYKCGGRKKKANGGLSRSKNYGSSKKPYPSVKSSDFAGGGRSYPIPTKADARDALRLAGLHNRPDVRAKVYAKYPSLRHKSKLGSTTPVEKFRHKAKNGIDYVLPTITVAAKRGNSNWFYPDTVLNIDNSPIPQSLADYNYVAPTYTSTPEDTSYLDRLARNAARQDRYGMDVRASDWIGLGTDLLGSVGLGILNNALLGDVDVNYTLPQYVDETPVAFDTTYHNGAQRANVERNRINVRNTIGRNTASANTTVQRMQVADTSAMMQQNELWDEKANKEAELRNMASANEQEVRARNAAARNAYYQQVAAIRNAEQDARNQLRLARAQSWGTTLKGIAGAANNFLGQTRQRYEDNQARLAYMSAAQPGTVARMLSAGYGDDNLAYRLYLMNEANDVTAPIAPSQSDYDLTTDAGRRAYNEAKQSYNNALIPYNDYMAIRRLSEARMRGRLKCGGKLTRKK